MYETPFPRDDYKAEEPYRGEEITRQEPERVKEIEDTNSIYKRKASVESLSSISMAPQMLPSQIQSQHLVHGNIEIKIADHFTKEDRFKDFTVYTIKGADTQGFIEVPRRYSDFVLIRKYLVLRWPGCFIPPLPSKNIMNNMEAEFLKQRRSGLDQFLQKVAELPHLHYSKEYQVFLRYLGTDLERELKAFQRIFYDEVIQRYASTFQHLAQIQSVNDAAMITTRFKSFLFKAMGRLKAFKNITREVAKAKKKFYEGMAAFQTHVAADYERDIIGEYQNYTNLKNVFCDPNSIKLNDNVSKIKAAINNGSVEHIDNWIAIEYKEMETLLEAIAQKDKFEALKTKACVRQRNLNADLQDITAGHFNFKTLFSSKNKEAHIAEINQEIAQCSKEIEQLSMLIDMISLVLAHIEIDKFKHNKSEKFYKLVNFSAQNELDNLATITEYWNAILSKNSEN